MFGREEGQKREETTSQVCLSLLDMPLSHIPRFEVSFHRRGHEDTRVPPLVTHVTARRCVIVEAARAGLIWNTFEVRRIFAPARENLSRLCSERWDFSI